MTKIKGWLDTGMEYASGSAAKEMGVTERRREVVAAHGGRAALRRGVRVERIAGTGPFGRCVARIEIGLLGRTPGDEVVIERRVVVLDYVDWDNGTTDSSQRIGQRHVARIPAWGVSPKRDLGCAWPVGAGRECNCRSAAIVVHIRVTQHAVGRHREVGSVLAIDLYAFEDQGKALRIGDREDLRRRSGADGLVIEVDPGRGCEDTSLDVRAGRTAQ